MARALEEYPFGIVAKRLNWSKKADMFVLNAHATKSL